MEIPTPKARSQLYKEAKILIITKQKRFICTALRDILIRRFGCNVKVRDIEIYFPELSRRPPIGDKSQTHILTECQIEAEYATN